MGGTDDNVKSNEKPCHDVSLSDFYMGETEVTQALWQAVMGNTISNQRDKAKSAYPSMNFPMRGMGDDYPMYYVSWEECQKFVTALNEKVREQLPKGWQFALPTESQWEYAARGGKQGGSYYKYSGSEKIDEVAWYGDNSGKQAHPVKKKKANELGLYDMSGNVWEWCQDWYGAYGNSFQSDPVGPASGRSCVLRGGSWRYGSDYCRVSNRGDSGDSLHGISSPGFRISYYGFRLSLVRK
jgi:formylglycine-generating enzyme required for sulfatase activity